jgi:hypothetical protein
MISVVDSMKDGLRSNCLAARIAPSVGLCLTVPGIIPKIPKDAAPAGLAREAKLIGKRAVLLFHHNAGVTPKAARVPPAHCRNYRQPIR